eukprot:1191168-Prorocentrum_minimum.AAC.4
MVDGGVAAGGKCSKVIAHRRAKGPAAPMDVSMRCLPKCECRLPPMRKYQTAPAHAAKGIAPAV